MNTNKLIYLHDQILCHNIKLQVIDFSNNLIPVIFQNTFVANTELRSINLRANLITQIFPGAFHTNHNITDIDLSHNKLQEIDHDVLSETQIKTLNVRANELTMTGNVPLLKAPLLEKLDLGLCGITALPPKAFQGMSQLKELILDNNGLSLLTEGDPENNTFTNLHQLSKLDLSSNNITEINSNFLDVIDNLDVLNVSFNPAVCGECRSEDKCNEFWSWCRSRSDRCVARCNVQAVNTENTEKNEQEFSCELCCKFYRDCVPGWKKRPKIIPCNECSARCDCFRNKLHEWHEEWMRPISFGEKNCGWCCKDFSDCVRINAPMRKALRCFEDCTSRCQCYEKYKEEHSKISKTLKK
jgi:hypothetical protein